MIGKFKRIYGYLIDGKAPGIIHEKFFVNAIPLFMGYLSFAFYRFIYPNLKTGKGMRCWGGVIIRKTHESMISIGDNAHIVSDYLRAGIAIFSKVKLTVFFASKIIIGSNVALIGTSITCRTTSIEIMDGVIIAPNVIIVDSDFHDLWSPDNRNCRMGYENDKAVKICKNVWIGMNSVILKGVTIGENSVIGAGSVVIGDIPENVIAAGNPARVVKSMA